MELRIGKVFNREINILVDAEGYFIQAFSKLLQVRPKFFVEIIQRKNATGFSSRNIKVLDEAVQIKSISTRSH